MASGLINLDEEQPVQKQYSCPKCGFYNTVVVTRENQGKELDITCAGVKCKGKKFEVTLPVLDEDFETDVERMFRVYVRGTVTTYFCIEATSAKKARELAKDYSIHDGEDNDYEDNFEITDVEEDE
jgi:transcription elongation factor Elf1